MSLSVHELIYDIEISKNTWLKYGLEISLVTLEKYYHVSFDL